MRKITVFYDGTLYTFTWLKVLLWAKKQFKERGYLIRFETLFEYFPRNALVFRPLIKDRLDQLLRDTKNRKFDIVILAFHHSTSEFMKIEQSERIEILKKIKEQSDMVVWLDTADSTGTPHFEVLPYVDRYLKKQILKDIELYSKPIWGSRLHCEYYHNKYGLDDAEICDETFIPLNMDYKDKIGVSWNVGLGELFGNEFWRYLYPYHYHVPKPVSPESEKSIDIHFRGSAESTTAGYQRRITAKRINECQFLNHPDASEKVSHDKYVEELKETKCIVSPFGYGEICTRDFETFLYGATLIKADMSHMITYPDVYIPNETYVPVDWDYHTFEDVLLQIRDSSEKFKTIAENGQTLYMKHLSDEGKKLFAEHLLGEIFDKGE